jgi:hypothetical protein
MADEQQMQVYAVYNVAAHSMTLRLDAGDEGAAEIEMPFEAFARWWMASTRASPLVRERQARRGQERRN